MRLLVDEKLMPRRSDDGRKILEEVSRSGDIYFSCHDFPPGIGAVRNEAIAILGLGVAVASLVVALLQLVRTPLPKRSREQFFDGTSRLLDAYGARIRKIEYDEDDVSNLISLNGMPLRVVLVLEDGSVVTIYLGATSKEVYASSIETDWRALLDED
jgi:hypothetical protein